MINESKVERVISKGEEMLDSEFNLIKIIKSLRDLKILLKEEGIMSKEAKIRIQNSGKNIITVTESGSD